jgi:hypothetical protein
MSPDHQVGLGNEKQDGRPKFNPWKNLIGEGGHNMSARMSLLGVSLVLSEVS